MDTHPTNMSSYLMTRMVVVGLCSEGVKTTATSLASQGCSSKRRTPCPLKAFTFPPACTGEAKKGVEGERNGQEKNNKLPSAVGVKINK